LINQFEELASLAEDQMTEAEKQLKASEDQLKALDDVVKSAQDQLSALRSVDMSVKSVEQAIVSLSAAIEAERAASLQLLNAQNTATTNAANRANQTPPVSASANSEPAGVTVRDLYQSLFNWNGDAAGIAYWENRFGSSIDQAEIDLFKWAGENTLRERGVPGFADGGFHAGGLRVVGERGPEIEATGPAMYWNASQTARMLGGGNMSEEIRGLREEVAMLRYETRATAVNTAKTSKVLERVTRDGESLLVTNA
jgi:hypothetical protein